MNKLFFCILVSTVVIISCKNNTPKFTEINVIPQPEKTDLSDAIFNLDNNTVICFDQSNKSLGKAALRLEEMLKRPLGARLIYKESIQATDKNYIHLIVDSNMADEAYILSISETHIEILGGTARGVFWGIQSLRQLMPACSEGDSILGSVILPCSKIMDSPRFSYRGMHLDVCRHFFTVEEVKSYIDLLAMHKFNTFHWHLTEDQGWRIEIKKYPELTRLGAWRDETVIGRNTGEFDGIRHGGYYTQEQIREIVQYAEDRFIMVIPEIEMPGHSLSALSAYPELGCTGGPYSVANTWGVFNDVFCAGKESTFEFLEDVIDEVCELFPNSPYIHIGGDECPKESWKKCPNCQKRIHENSLKDESELQSYFVQRVEQYINSKGKRIIGWDEILEGGLAPDATVMSWRGEDGAIEAAHLKHDVIMAPNAVCYFDHYQSEDVEKEPLAIGGFTDCAKIYEWDPVPHKLPENERVFILGAQANVWTEYILNGEHIQYMVLPRMAALSEVLWCKQKPGYDSFLYRLQFLFQRYNAAGYNYAKHLQKGK